jgi:hypothetical protein
MKHGNKKHAEWNNTVLGSIEIDGTRLVAEVNSKARADAIRNKIETALGEGIRYLASEIQSPEKMLAEMRAAGGGQGGAASEEHDRLVERPEVRDKISEMMAAHWEHWVNQPLPILGNRTPTEAVRDPDGREIVESLVIQAERLGRSPNVPTDEYVFRRLRKQQSLEWRRRAQGGGEVLRRQLPFREKDRFVREGPRVRIPLPPAESRCKPGFLSVLPRTKGQALHDGPVPEGWEPEPRPYAEARPLEGFARDAMRR